MEKNQEKQEKKFILIVALLQGQALLLMQNCVTHQRSMAKQTKCWMFREKTKHHVARIDLKLSKYA